jgi:hypothetical protein
MSAASFPNQDQKPKFEAKSIFTLYEEIDIETKKNDGTFELVHYDEPTNEDYFVKKTKAPAHKLELTKRVYLLEPIIKFPFLSLNFNQKLHNLVKETFESKSKGVYNPNELKICCRSVTDKARMLAKSIKLDRYKYIVNTYVLQNLGQSVSVASMATSSLTSDGYICEKYETKEYVVICILYAIYRE